MRNASNLFEDRIVLLVGATGSLGNAFTDNLLSGDFGSPKRIIIFSRDEAKQYSMSNRLRNDYRESIDKVHFRIGDVRDKMSAKKVLLEKPDTVVNMSALKHIPPYEYLPEEAIKTNIHGIMNLVDAIRESTNSVESFVQVSTDKACKPVNVYGMTKALAERIATSANLYTDSTAFFCVRYGNVLQSRGSMIPFFKRCFMENRPIPLTDSRMTRFLMTLQDSCLLILRSIEKSIPGTILIPKLDSVQVVDVIEAMKKHYNKPDLGIENIGIRPGEKIDEILISEEEIPRTKESGDDYVVLPQFSQVPGHDLGKLASEQLQRFQTIPPIKMTEEYSSRSSLLDMDACYERLKNLGVFGDELST
jgi:UDP-glucose 4-epimerase